MCTQCNLALCCFSDNNCSQGLYSLRRHRLINIRIPIINLRRSSDRLGFIMGIPIPLRRRLLSEQRPWRLLCIISPYLSWLLYWYWGNHMIMMVIIWSYDACASEVTPEDMFNTLRLRQNGRRFADNTFKHIFLNENVRILIKISRFQVCSQGSN